MNNRNQEIAINLLKMVELDFLVRDELAKTGELYQGYHERMESIHNQNAEELERIIYEIGWPTVEKVGEEASYAAWVILQHAISKPSFQRKSLHMLKDLAEKSMIDKKAVAMLHDRICFFEMKPQKYGTQFDFDENNMMNPWVIEDIQNVDAYRSEVGLPPLEEIIKVMQLNSKLEEETLVMNYENRLKARTKWAKEVGWIE